MDINESIIELGSKLDAWLDGNLDTISSMDRVAQFKALLAGVEITKELDQLKAKGLAAITELVNQQHALPEAQRVMSLLRGFEFGAKLSATLHDELMDTDGGNKVWRLTRAIADALDAIGPGRAALAGLLDHSDDRVRAAAGAHLMELMPDRVLPILQKIADREPFDSAASTAHWTIVHWEREGKFKAKSK